MIRKTYSRWSRYVASGVFVVGGAASVLLLRWGFILLGMGSGMSAGPVPNGFIHQTPLLCLVSLYFAICAIGVFVAGQRSVMWLVAVLSHLILLAAFCRFCADTLYAHYIFGVSLNAVLFAVFFSPWILVWCVLLFKRNEPVA